MRLIKSGDRAARFAMASAALGVAAVPLDLLFRASERRRYDRAATPRRPIVLVAGPPRSGTTLLTQVLIRNLPVAFINNLTGIFPRSPLTANRWFGRIPQQRPSGYHSYYGKSPGFAGPNDGLHLWDRWLGGDRTRIPEALPGSAAHDMVRFFGAFEALYGAPLVAKNNSLNATASLVAGVLPSARFLCLRRDPVFLAQSLLRARRDIHGRDEVPYGLAEAGAEPADPITGVCRQVAFHEALARKQLDVLGPDRFRIVSYEAFCRAPFDTVQFVAEAILGETYRPEWRDPGLTGFEVANRPRIDPESFARLESALSGLRDVPAAP